MPTSGKAGPRARYAALDSWRFFAALGVVAYHFENHFSPIAAEPSQRLAAFGHFVDFFFILSGFVLMHTYGGSVRSFAGYREFVRKRMARIYPLHAAMVLLFVIAIAAIAIAGFKPRVAGTFDPALVLPHLLLIHAWGFELFPGLNFPSWSISAELFVYLLFPAFAWQLKRSGPAAMLAMALAFATAMEIARLKTGMRSFTEATWDFGMLRAVPAFVAGMAVQQFVAALPRTRISWRAAHGFMIILLALMIMGAPVYLLLILFAMAVGIIALAERDAGPSILQHRFFGHLGDASYGVYLLHTPFQIAATAGARMLGINSWPALILVAIGTSVIIVTTAVLVFRYFENPARRALSRPLAPQRATRGSRTMKIALAQALLPCFAIVLSASAFAAPPQLKVSLSGPQQTVFKPGDGCDGHDVPDLAARAWRGADGRIGMFALHYINRPLRGTSLDNLKVECKAAYGSGFNPDPAAYDAQNWIAATWTADGKHVEALVHHEYRAAHYKRCGVPVSAIACWYNTMLAATSSDNGASFAKHAYPVAAAAPFQQEFEQQRHRGFLNPSNMFGHNGHVYFFAAQTGWRGQPHGVCLFRSADPSKPRSWRAWDGRDFSILYDDPYRPGMRQPSACKPVEPFPAQVGAVVRHRSSELFLAVVQAWKDDKRFPVSGFYYATSRDLLNWSDPRLLMATKSLYDNACGAQALNSYPSILDLAAQGRNFDDAGGSAWLYWSSMRIDGCKHTGDRKLIRQNMVIELLSTGRS